MEETKYAPINGWTKESIKERIITRVPVEGSFGAVPEKVGAGNGEMCLYRRNKAPCGPACAAGAFIPDPMYSDSFEGLGTIEDVLQWDTNLVRHMPLSMEGMKALQHAHDFAWNHSSTGNIRAAILWWVDRNVL